jgi:hypothetical protein
MPDGAGDAPAAWDGCAMFVRSGCTDAVCLQSAAPEPGNTPISPAVVSYMRIIRVAEPDSDGKMLMLNVIFQPNFFV